MPLSPEDDFGSAKPKSRFGRKNPGTFTPRNLIGNTLLDLSSEEPRFNGIRDLVRLATSRRQSRPTGGDNEGDEGTPATPATSSREVKANSKSTSYKYNIKHQGDSQLDELVFAHDIDLSGRSGDIEMQEQAQQSRRLKKPVVGANGKVKDAQRPSSNSGRPSSIRHLDYTPALQKHPLAGNKRQFAWIHRPTAWENPVTYEDPPEPGKRPSHPVSNTQGAKFVVATEHKRAFPDKVAATAIPVRRMSKAEENRVVDAQTEMNFYHDTSWLTKWHWDPICDIEPVKPNKYSSGMPIHACTTTCDESVHRRPAGRRSGLVMEEGQTRTPLTAR